MDIEMQTLLVHIHFSGCLYPIMTNIHILDGHFPTIHD